MKIGIAGGGVGGMAAAIALQKQGHDVTIFERARAFGRIGADVNLTPNAVHALDGWVSANCCERLRHAPNIASAEPGIRERKPHVYQ
ncbi:NAD(P)-binding protein [Nitratireductor aquibiodomus]|uniref:NAD(P)-binding protein n=1 Tax=Nitratireductor aquibiodomus TaxID=204799 RepID=UPI000AC8B167|nr:NAD(P)-binding protein [Nitratireductor aquibiodomus]